MSEAAEDQPRGRVSGAIKGHRWLALPLVATVLFAFGLSGQYAYGKPPSFALAVLFAAAVSAIGTLAVVVKGDRKKQSAGLPLIPASDRDPVPTAFRATPSDASETVLPSGSRSPAQLLALFRNQRQPRVVLGGVFTIAGMLVAVVHGPEVLAGIFAVPGIAILASARHMPPSR